MVVESLADQPQWCAAIAQWQFAQWGRLTGFPSQEEYAEFLRQSCKVTELPRVLVARADGQLLGSVNIVAGDMSIRAELKPWLGQLFVAPDCRGVGVGGALVKAAVEWTCQQGFHRLYLYTSGTLPCYYNGLGFAVLERVEYLGGARTVMVRDLSAQE
ncbi:MAG: GNAT family N-acetyltransferase [Candidatus Latescibacteria bacterium]|nr:GNAT family N-acetyltransferase [Candidatus Latescibacterota bacterium]